jgi:DNA repair protein RadA/Sms
MKKTKNFVFRCTSCGHEEPKWLGRCPECGEWNTLTETPIAKNQGKGDGDKSIPHSTPLSGVDAGEGNRVLSGIAEFDNVLGGGMMKQSSILVGGEPGIGKSTLLLQTAALSKTRGRVLYVSAEESAAQVKMRADRLGLSAGDCEKIEIFCGSQLEDIMTILDAVKPIIIIIDSIQMIFSGEAGSTPGTISQLNYCSYELTTWIKDHDAILFLVAPVTKEGVISGPKTLEHMVDTVLYFEQSENDSRFLRAAKNRFGSVDEVGIFIMNEKGLAPVDDPSMLFLVRREGALPPGVATAAVLEGSRTLLVEIQALTVGAKGAVSRVFSDRIAERRVSRIAATLEKALGLVFSDQDIYVNVAGGLRVNDVGVELAVAAALYSARTGLPLPERVAIAGELSLAAEVLPIRRLAIRAKTAVNLGFERFVSCGGTGNAEGAEKLSSAKNLRAAIGLLFER